MFEHLPFDDYEQRFVDMMRGSPASILVAQTGAGKSTRGPLALLRAGFADHGRIAVLVPRRVIAVRLARWVAKLHGTAVGDVVGYQIGGERVLSERTKLVFMTTRVLLNQLLRDRGLSRYSMVIIDEAHERLIDQDIALAHLKLLLARRTDLREGVFSATINAGAFADYLGQAPVLDVPGRTYSVDISYEHETPGTTRELIQAIGNKVAWIIHQSGRAGDVLVFLPDEHTIKKTCEELERRNLPVRALPLYGAQSPEEQDAAFVVEGLRRVIVATNIAETSLTIEGVTHVIDSGLIKQTQYVNANMSSLQIVEHSQAGCDQRAGRAGRTQAGWCYRLFTRENFLARSAYTQPEILRTSLDGVLLDLLVNAYAFQEILALPLMDPVPESRWHEARERLHKLRAITRDNAVTADGHTMASLPVSPMVARMILSADAYGCLDEVITVAAGFGARSVFTRPRDKEKEADKEQEAFKDETSDALTLLSVWNAWNREDQDRFWARDRYLSSRALEDIERTRGLIVSACKRARMTYSSSADPTLIVKAVASGLILNLARRTGRFSYVMGDAEVYIHPSSSVFGEKPPGLIVCAEVVETTKKFCRGVSAVENEWLAEILPPDMLEVRYTVQPPSSILGTPFQVVREVRFQGMAIVAEPVTKMDDQVRDALTQFASSVVIDHYRSLGSLPSSLVMAQRTFLALKIAIGDCLDDQLAQEAQRKLREIYRERVQPIKMVDEFLAIDFHVGSSDLFEASFLERAGEARQERENTRQVRLEEAQQEAEHRRTLREQAIAPVRARLDAAVDGLALYALASDVRSAISAARFDMTYGGTVESVTSLVEHAMRLLEEHLATQAEAIAHGARLREMTLAEFPVCPLCSEAWTQKDKRVLLCEGQHDMRRLLTPATEAVDIAVVNTKRRGNPDRVARVSVVGQAVLVSFDTPDGMPWTGKTFTGVEVEQHTAILPAAYAQDRDFILDLLAEIQKLELALKARLDAVRIAGAAAKAGDVRKLTFKIVGGRAVAVQDGRRYVATFDAIYPNDGETWYCLVSESLSGHEAKALFKLEDPETLKSELLDAYPDLPASLLQ